MKKNAAGLGLFLIIAGVLWILNMLDVSMSRYLPLSQNYGRCSL